MLYRSTTRVLLKNLFRKSYFAQNVFKANESFKLTRFCFASCVMKDTIVVVMAMSA